MMRPEYRLLLHILALVAILDLSVATRTRADEWEPPGISEFLSPNGEYRLVIAPGFGKVSDDIAAIFRPLPGDIFSLDYPTKLALRDAMRPHHFENWPQHSLPAAGHMQVRTEQGAWKTVWKGPLLNTEMPVEVLVGNDGTVATLDDWGYLGRGRHALVIYDRQGRVIRSMELGDILPDAYIAALGRSVSSIWWYQEAVFDSDGNVALRAGPIRTGGTPLDIVVRTADGTVVIPDTPAVHREMGWAACAAQVNTAISLRDLAKLRSPLMPPETRIHALWEEYLTNAYERTEPASHDGVHAFVLPRRRAPTYTDAVISLAQSLPSNDVAAIALPGPPEELADMLADLVENLPAGALSGKRLYLATTAEQFAKARTILAPTRADLRLFDIRSGVPVEREALQNLYRTYGFDLAQVEQRERPWRSAVTVVRSFIAKMRAKAELPCDPP